MKPCKLYAVPVDLNTVREARAFVDWFHSHAQNDVTSWVMCYGMRTYAGRRVVVTVRQSTMTDAKFYANRMINVFTAQQRATTTT